MKSFMQSQNRKPIRNRGEERMNRRNLFLKTYTAFLTVMMITGFSFASLGITANTGEALDGSLSSFGFNNETEVSGVKILASSGVELDGTSLSRLDDFIIQFDVYDIDGFANLDFYIALYNTDTRSTNSGLLNAVINSGVSDTALVMRWIAPERSVYLSGLASSGFIPINSGFNNFYVKSGITPLVVKSYNSGIEDFVTPSAFNARTDVSWEVTTSGLNTASGLVIGSGNVVTYANGVATSSGVRNIQYRVQIPIKLSKIASSSGVWNLGVMAYDLLQVEIEEPKTDIEVLHPQWAGVSFTNQWYGEVSIIGTSGIVFTDVQAGSGAFQTSDSGIRALFISNGEYRQQVQADTTWNPAQTFPNRVNFAFLVPSSGLSGNTLDSTQQGLLDSEGNRFSLQARRLSIAGDSSGIQAYQDIVLTGSDVTAVPDKGESTLYRQNLTPDNVRSSLITSIALAPGTSEAGVESTFDFALKLSPVFQNTTYSGGVSIGVSNSPGTFFNPGN